MPARLRRYAELSLLSAALVGLTACPEDTSSPAPDVATLADSVGADAVEEDGGLDTSLDSASTDVTSGDDNTSEDGGEELPTEVVEPEDTAETSDGGLDDIALDLPNDSTPEIDADGISSTDANDAADGIDDANDANDAGGDAVDTDVSPVDPCKIMCDAVAELSCEEFDYDDCYDGCTTVAAPDSPCSYHAPALMECIVTSDFACGGDWGFQPTDCEESYTLVNECLFGLAYCPNLCNEGVPLGCSEGPPTQEACVQGCQDVANSPCGTLLHEAVWCVEDVPDGGMQCTEDGQLALKGCDPETQAYLDCFAQLQTP